jgi:hypothetical protein
MAKPPGKLFSNGVVPAGTPSSSTVSPGGLLGIFCESTRSKEGRHDEKAQRNRHPDRGQRYGQGRRNTSRASLSGASILLDI